ncbi:unnamed protein product [Rhizoctonia solani]|uniref:NACHT domain-containing protein n=1 Tax=Rhizoctonia solani TaxID=456999 RepID=A0A8H3DE55_9AGAM|nr:unnamed protein product [Rhizoctonia solani]
MSSRPDKSKSKKGFRGFWRDTFSRSSLHVPGTPESAAQSTLRASSLSGGPRAVNLSSGLKTPRLAGERPTTSHSMSAPPEINAAPTEPQPNPQPNPVPSDQSSAPEHHDFTLTETVTNTVWIALRSSLRRLKDKPGIFSGLSVAAGILLECFDGIEIAARSQEDYESLAKQLEMLSESLVDFNMASIPPPTTKCMSNITSEIEHQADEIKKKRSQGGGRFYFAKADEESVLKCYRQSNLNISMWSITNEHLVYSRLEALQPVKDATYDSKLSATVGRRKCTKGTRKYVLENMNKWLYDQDAPRVYWMNGMAGTGKTTIACTYSEQLEHHQLLAASFFCTRSSADCRNPTRIIPTIAYQLAHYSIPFQLALYEILGKEPDAGSKTMEKQFERLLRDPLLKVKEAMPSNLVVVIDALDECEDPNSVEALLGVLFRHASDMSLKFLITSRPEPEIYKRMTTHTQSRAVFHLHDIEASLVQADIALYLQEELAFMSLTPTQISQLVHQSGSLFIYAATLVRYIQSGERRSDPARRLQSVLTMTPEATRRHAQIDALYTTVLGTALNEEEMEKDEMEDIRVVLRTVLLAQEPINVETVAILAGIDDPRRVMSALQPLRSVLHQSEQTGLVSTLHASFPDFMFNTERSGMYFYDILEHSQVLAERCFRIMREQLRFNICALESSFVCDDEVEGLDERIKSNISPTLAYACRYWGSHMGLASKSENLLMMVREFISDRLLFWMETLSLRREVSMGLDTMLKTQRWLNQAALASSELAVMVEDACNFVTSFAGSPVSRSTPHIYISCLPFCPRSSVVHKHYWNRTHGLMELDGSLMGHKESAALAVWNIDSEVTSLAYSPDSTRVAVSCYNHTLRILDAHDGTSLVDPLQDHTDAVGLVAFSPDSKLVASGSSDHTIRVLNAYSSTLAVDPFKGHTSFVLSVSFSPDGKCIVSGSADKTIRIWNVEDGTLMRGPLEGHDAEVYCVAFSPDGNLIASGSSDNTVRLWNSHNGTPTAPPLQGHTGAVLSVAFTPDSNRLVSGSDDRTIRIWTTSEGSLATKPFEGHPDYVRSVAVSPDGRRVASGSGDCTVRVWDIDDGTLVAGPFTGHSWNIWSVAFSPDGNRVISGSWDRTIRVWNVRDGLSSFPPPFQSHISGLRSVFVSGSGARILSGSEDSSSCSWAWDIASDEVIPSSLNQKLAFFTTNMMPSGFYFPMVDEDYSISVINTNDGSLLAQSMRGHTDAISSFGFSADDTHLVTGSRDRTIHVWNLHKSGLAAAPFRGHGAEVTYVAISSDHSRVVSWSKEDQTIRVWNTRNVMIPLSLLPSAPIEASSGDSPSDREDWVLRDSGWVTNSSSALLFWVPPDIVSRHACPSPHAEFIITKDGVLHIVQKELAIGDRWSECYIGD